MAVMLRMPALIVSLCFVAWLLHLLKQTTQKEGRTRQRKFLNVYELVILFPVLIGVMFSVIFWSGKLSVPFLIIGPIFGLAIGGFAAILLAFAKFAIRSLGRMFAKNTHL